MSTVATYNPVTYLLDALRSPVSNEWETDTLVIGIGALLGVGVVSMSLALWTFRSRLRKS